MNCPSCGSDNRAERRFCASCGKQMVRCCSRCGFANLPEEVHCGGCGALYKNLKKTMTDKTTAPRESSSEKIASSALRELNIIREKAGKPKVEKSATLSQDDIERMLEKK